MFYWTVMGIYGYAKIYLFATCAAVSMLEALVGPGFVNSYIFCIGSGIQSVYLDDVVHR